MGLAILKATKFVFAPSEFTHRGYELHYCFRPDRDHEVKAVPAKCHKQPRVQNSLAWGSFTSVIDAVDNSSTGT
jgi:hypothetical protein